MSHPRARRVRRIAGETVVERRVAIEGLMMIFVVRLTRDEVGRITGVVEQVKTGLKARVEGLEAVGRAIGEIIAPSVTEQVQNPPEAGGSR